MSDSELARLYDDMAREHLTPLWKLESSILPPVPCPKSVAWLWKWKELFDVASRSGRLVTIERGGDRRAVALSNPGLGGAPYATPTLWAAVQWLNGHEVAPAHRHTAQAVRFIIDGRGGYSTVQGDKVYLGRGDMVINPPWYWHDHGSDADEPTIWMDGLDIPLNNYLDANFFEPHAGEQQAVTQVLDGSVMKYGVGQLRPAWEPRSDRYPPIFAYKWELTERALLNLSRVDSSPFDDVALEYTNPHTGRSVMDTISCWIQMLRPAAHTQAHRHTSSAVYYVFEGRGATVIDGIRFDWEQGDMFVVPSWAAHEHLNALNDQRAVMFSIHDTPVMAALGKYREEPLPSSGGRQKVTGRFDSTRVQRANSEAP
ncbi:MAG: cupin domain-containing protein [Acidobacteria bacterium]|nr:cupin domain-containing protein [Acidobacteriota bacterium]